MNKVTFRAKQAYFTLMHEVLFPVSAGKTNGYTINQTTGEYHQYIPPHEMEEIKKIPDWERIGSGYLFSEGENHNEFTTDKEVVIEAIRAYIKTFTGENAGIIVEV